MDRRGLAGRLRVGNPPVSLAIDERAEHPIGVLKAEYGHLLMMVTVLHEKPDGDPALPPPECSGSPSP
jgi:hypothetical protein